MEITHSLTDDAILSELGERLARNRLARNLTQQQLADEAGISVDTVRRLEGKRSITLTGLLRLLRALDQLDVLDLLMRADEMSSPIEQLERERARRRRGSGVRGQDPRSDSPSSADEDDEAKASAWEWGE